MPPPNPQKVEGIVREGLNTHVATGKWPSAVPYLVRDFLISQKNGAANSDAAWQYLFRRLKNFRQARHDNDRGQPFGRSKWPEPDAIRDITGESATKHSRRRLTFNKFPRAKFGLPIIFQFKDIDIRPNDPGQTTLQGKESDRLSSPLILRPIACENNRAVGLAAILNGPTDPPGGLILTGAFGERPVDSRLLPLEANQIEPLHGVTDVLQAFLDYLK